MKNIPIDRCACGCGGQTTIARTSRNGLRVGQRHRYIHGHNNRRGSLWARLYEKLESRGGCLVWTGAVNAAGYGIIQAGTHAKSRTRLVHRTTWEIVNGPIPAGLHVLHHCDNPPCCDPAHLFLGTPRDNVDDMVSKGRHLNKRKPTAMKQYKSLTRSEVEEVRAKITEGCSTIGLATAYSVCANTIRNIKYRRTRRYA